MIGLIRKETLDLVVVLFVTHQQGISVLLREQMLPSKFDTVLLNFKDGYVDTKLFVL